MIKKGPLPPQFRLRAGGKITAHPANIEPIPPPRQRQPCGLEPQQLFRGFAFPQISEQRREFPEFLRRRLLRRKKARHQFQRVADRDQCRPRPPPDRIGGEQSPLLQKNELLMRFAAEPNRQFSPDVENRAEAAARHPPPLRDSVKTSRRFGEKGHDPILVAIGQFFQENRPICEKLYHASEKERPSMIEAREK